MSKTLLLIIFTAALFAFPAYGQKKKTVLKPAGSTLYKSGVYKTIKSGKDTIKFVRLDSATKSATVEGVTTDWEKDGTVYFTIDLKRGQHLIITPEPNEISISAAVCGDSSDGTLSGVYDLEATATCGYDISAASAKPGKKYTLKLQLKR